MRITESSATLAPVACFIDHPLLPPPTETYLNPFETVECNNLLCKRPVTPSFVNNVSHKYIKTVKVDNVVEIILFMLSAAEG